MIWHDSMTAIRDCMGVSAAAVERVKESTHDTLPITCTLNLAVVFGVNVPFPLCQMLVVHT